MIDQNLVQLRNEHNVFSRDLGIEVDYVEEKEACLKLMIRQHHLNVHKTVHGGVLMSLADTACGFACMYLNEKITTCDLEYRFLKPVFAGQTVQCIAKVVREGGHLLTLEAKLTVEGELIGLATSSFFRSREKTDYYTNLTKLETGNNIR